MKNVRDPYVLFDFSTYVIEIRRETKYFSIKRFRLFILVVFRVLVFLGQFPEIAHQVEGAWKGVLVRL